ncbi:MAG: ribosome small subunit-dependent GTPase A [Bacillota bacterium]
MIFNGRVMKACGGFYQVSIDGHDIRCRARGKLKNRNDEVYVGDFVDVSMVNDAEGVIEDILPRRILLTRPYIANVDHVFIVFSLADPAPGHMLIDRFLLLAGEAGLSVTMVFNKQDLVKPGQTGRWMDFYRKVGYDCISTSALQRVGKRKLLQRAKNRVSVLTGPSGVGKSALLNMIGPWNLATGRLSARIERGRHTTRMVQLLPLGGEGFIADTPGFTQLDLSNFPGDSLDRYFPDFEAWRRECRFNGCRHVAEPGCMVKKAVEDGLILPERYRSYVDFTEEINAFRRRKY